MATGPTIGVLTPLAGGFYFGGLLNGIALSMTRAHGRMIAIQTLDAGHLNADIPESPPFDSTVGWDRIDGFIVVVNAVRPAFLARLRDARKPFAMVSNEVKGFPCPSVAPDNRTGVIEAVRHLAAHGHTRIGFAGFMGQADIRERYRAYLDALAECGIAPEPSLVYHATDNDEVGGSLVAEEILAGGLRSTALVAGTDLNAIGIMRELRAAGYELPRDQAIVGFDDTEAAGHVTPALSSVRQDFEDVGAIAANLLLARLRGEPVDDIRHEVRTSFVARESCGCAQHSAQDPQSPQDPQRAPRHAERPADGGYQGRRLLLDMLTAQYDVSMDLLRGLEHDPRDLSWLTHTKARAGVLGLWRDGPGSDVEIVGAYNRGGDHAQGEQLPTALPIESFPPENVLVPNPGPSDMVFAVPVKIGESDWGWLVTVGPVESVALTGREMLNQWAALLTVALDQAAASDEVKRLERELRAILQNSPDAIARYDSRLRYEYLNAAAVAALGVEYDEIVGRTDDELGRDRAVTEIWEAGLRQVLVANGSTEVEYSEGSGNDTRWYQAKMVPQFDADGMIVGVLTSTRDMTAVKRAELALAHQAVHDSLTGLANRVLFADRLSQAITRLEREPGRLAVLFIDLDGFKEVNDTLGHDAGDRLLVQVATRLRKASRRVDTVARFGGDEFVLLCDKLSAEEDIRIIAERVVRSLAAPFFDSGQQLEVSGSIGIVVVTDAYMDATRVIRDADAAMYQAKERGGNRFHVFDPELHERATARQALEADLRHALGRRELTLAFQPLFGLGDGVISGVEALLRWQHPQRGTLLPADFMGIAEQRGLIIPIGAWVLDEACRQLAEWTSSDPSLSDLTMAVNVSGRQLTDPRFVETVREALTHHGVRASRITLEMTETTLIEDAANVRDTLGALAGLGVHLALDDFGTGYSSLAHLRDFQVDILKIDRSFVEQLGDGGRAREIVGALTAMAHFLDMTVVGEGIETSKQWDELKNLHCDDGQGFVLARPLPPDEILSLLRRSPAG